MVSRMARHYPAGCEINDGQVDAINEYDTANDDDTDKNYGPDDDASDTSDPPPDTPKEKSADYISNLDDENSSIILNPSGV